MIKYLLSEDNRELNITNCPHKGSLSYGYKPKLDVMDECGSEHVSWFHKLIGIFRWTVDLGRVDIQI